MPYRGGTLGDEVNEVVYKQELIDLVSRFLIKEPDFEYYAPAQNPSHVTEEAPPLVLESEEAMLERLTIYRMQRLVELISKRDAEFVQKLALYLRHDLRICRTPSYLVALCSREAACAPWLMCYMERLIVSPLDWLAIANDACWLYSDVTQNNMDSSSTAAPATSSVFRRPQTRSRSRSSSRGVAIDEFIRPDAEQPSSEAYPVTDPSELSTPFSRSGSRIRRQRSPSPPLDTAAPSRIPAALRKALVHCFRHFTVSSLAQVNSEHAGKRGRKAAKQRRAAAACTSHTEAAGSTHTGSHSAAGWKEDKAKCWAAVPPRITLTLKQLVRALHITEPAYAVCCLLGRRYPSDATAFERMGLSREEGCAFEPCLAGTRMRLPVYTTWEKQVSLYGKRGPVWDEIIAAHQLPFTAILPNLRHILTCGCATETHASLLARLQSEDEVSNSQQLPFCFFRGYTAIDDAEKDVRATAELWERRRRAREAADSQINDRCSTEARSSDGGTDLQQKNDDMPSPLPNKRSGDGTRARELPNRSLEYFLSQARHYRAALDRSIEIAARVNVLPISGSSIVILSVSPSMHQLVTAVDGGAVAPLRTKLQIASLMATMMKYACEDCVVVVHCFDRSVVYDAPHFRSASLLSNVAQLHRMAGEMLVGEASTVSSRSGAFPFVLLNQIIERRVAVQSLLVIDEGHHTYSDMNADAPALGDLPVYLSRLRRTCNEDLVYVGLSLAARSPKASPLAEGDDDGLMRRRMNGYAHERYTHRNDILLTGFSDSILRLIAERCNGGAIAAVEQASDVYGVNRSSARGQPVPEGVREAELEAQSVQHRRVACAGGGTAFPLPPGSGEGIASTAALNPGGWTQSTAPDGPRGVPLDTQSSLDFHNQALPGVVLDGVKKSSHEELKHLGGKVAGYAEVNAESDVLATLLSQPYPPISTIGVTAGSAASSLMVRHPTPFITLSHLSQRPADPTRQSNKAWLSSRGNTPAGSEIGEAAGRGSEVAGPPSATGQPLTSFREFRFFVSSTFLDMNNERNALTLDVFPRLRRWAAEQSLRVTILEVDLRWGITEVATHENLSTSVCLNQVSRCSPFFIGILGSRYGSCPTPIHIVADDDIDLEDYAWLEDVEPELEGRISVTELEMRHGVYNARRRVKRDGGPGISAGSTVAPPSTALFFCRDADWLAQSLPKDERAVVYAPDGATATDSIARLKRYLTNQAVPLVVYKAAYLEPSPVSAKGLSTPEGDLRTTPLLVRPGGVLASLPDLPSTNSPEASREGRLPPRRQLTSRDVQLNMKEFSEKALQALQQLISQACGVSACEENDCGMEAVGAGLLQGPTTPTFNHAAPLTFLSAFERRRDRTGRKELPTRRPRHPSDFYTRQLHDMQIFQRRLCQLYVPPGGLIEQLAKFAITGMLQQPSAPSANSSMAKPGGYPGPGALPWRRTTANAGSSAVEGHGLEVVGAAINVVVLEGRYGDGKSSALSALSLYLVNSQLPVNGFLVYHSAQAGDGTLRGLLLYLAASLALHGGLDNEFCISDRETIPTLLHVLPAMYAALRRRHRSVVVLLDAPEMSLEASEVLRHLGAIVCPAPADEIRYIVATSPSSPFSRALRARDPAAHVISVPPLDGVAQAQVIRKHLAHHGKQLQESMDMNELKALLRKQDACLPSFLTAAIMCLRLFSSFDTLRDDIRQLPGTISPLYELFFRKLETRFEADICRLVLTTLYLRQSVGGIMEYSLYRLVPHVQVTSRLIALLLGTCVTSVRGRLFLTNTFFENTIATTYLPQTSARRRALENLLAAELLCCPLSPSRREAPARDTVASVVESIQKNASDPTVPCIFDASRYAPHELLSILRTAVQAHRHDVAVTLVSYLPFIENLLQSPSMLHQLVRVLDQLSAVSRLVAQRVSPIVGFLRQHDDVLCVRPGLLSQCVLNAPSFTAISRYSSSTVTLLSSHSPNNTLATSVVPHTVVLPAEATATSPMVPTPLLPTTWIRWVNLSEHKVEHHTSVRSRAPSSILCMALSADGSQIATGCRDGVLRVAPRLALEQPAHTLTHAGAVTAVAYVPQRPSVIVSGCAKGLLYVWSLEDGTLLQIGLGHLRGISAIACHPKEAMVCTGSMDSFCMLWNILGTSSAASQHLSSRKPPDASATQWPKAPAFSLPRFAAVKVGAGPQCILRPFDIQRHHQAAVSTVAFHKAGEVVATGSWDGTVYLVNLYWTREDDMGRRCRNNGGSPIGKLPVDNPAGHADASPFSAQCFPIGTPVRTVRFAPSAVVTCAVGTLAGFVSLLDYAAGHAADILDTKQQLSAPITALSFSPDGKYMATADERGVLHLHYAGVTGTRIGSFEVHRGAVTGIEFVAPDHDSNDLRVMSCGVDSSLQTLHILNPSEHAVSQAQAAPVTAIAVAAEGDGFATGCADGTVLIFLQNERDRLSHTLGRRPAAAEAGDVEHCFVPAFTLSHNGYRVSCLQFGLQNTRILVGVAIGYVYVWASTPGLNRRAGRLLQRVRVPASGLYPVVSIECREVTNPQTDEPPSGSLGAPSWVTSAQVCAMCSNGAMAIFTIYNDSVYCQERLLHRRRDAGLSFTGGGISPTDSPSPSTGDNDYSGTCSYVSLAGGLAAMTGLLSRDLHRLDGSPVAMQEDIDFHVQRLLLRWVPASPLKQQTPPPVVPFFNLTRGGHGHLPRGGGPTAFSTHARHSERLGEEVIASIPIRFDDRLLQVTVGRTQPAGDTVTQQSGHPSQERRGDASVELLTPIGSARTTSRIQEGSPNRCRVPLSFELLPTAATSGGPDVRCPSDSLLEDRSLPLPSVAAVEDQHFVSLLIGQQRIFLFSSRHGRASPVEVHQATSDAYLALGEEGHFTAWSEPRPFPTAVAGGLGEDGAGAVLFALATNTGGLLIIRASFGDPHTDTGQAKSCDLTLDEGYDRLRRLLCLSLIHRTTVLDLNGYHGAAAVTMRALDVVLTAGRLCILVGCSDRSTRVLVATLADAPPVPSPGSYTVPSQPSQPPLHLTEVGLFLCSSSLLSLRVIPSRVTDHPAAACPKLRWVTGDVHGNVYQLRMDSQVDIVMQILRSGRGRQQEPSKSVDDTALQRLMESAGGAAATLMPSVLDDGSAGALCPGTAGGMFTAFVHASSTTGLTSPEPITSTPEVVCASSTHLEAGGLSTGHHAIGTLLPSLSDLYNSVGSLLGDSSGEHHPLARDGVENCNGTDVFASLAAELKEPLRPLPSFATHRLHEETVAQRPPATVAAPSMAGSSVTRAPSVTGTLSGSPRLGEALSAAEATSPTSSMPHAVHSTSASQEDYFRVLLEAGPPAHLDIAERQTWIKHRQHVLTEAIRVQHYNVEARQALRLYSRACIQPGGPEGGSLRASAGRTAAVPE